MSKKKEETADGIMSIFIAFIITAIVIVLVLFVGGCIVQFLAWNLFGTALDIVTAALCALGIRVLFLGG